MLKFILILALLPTLVFACFSEVKAPFVDGTVVEGFTVNDHLFLTNDKNEDLVDTIELIETRHYDTQKIVTGVF